MEEKASYTNNKSIKEKIEKIESTSNKDQKQFLAYRVAEMVKDGDVIGFGSGSTSFLTIKTIAKVLENKKIKITAVPSSNEIAELCMFYGIDTKSLNDAKIDWSFDGTDEVDMNNNLIKGKGKCMFKEKLNFLNSPKVFVLADETKHVRKLGEKTAIPVECYTGAVKYVSNELFKLGATSCELVKENGKLAITDLGNYIIATKFDNGKINKTLEEKMKTITGVIETGLFYGYKNIEIL